METQRAVPWAPTRATLRAGDQLLLIPSPDPDDGIRQGELFAPPEIHAATTWARVEEVRAEGFLLRLYRDEAMTDEVGIWPGYYGQPTIGWGRWTIVRDVLSL